VTVLDSAPVFAIAPAQDLDRARKFYRDTLGLEIVEETGGGIQFQAGQHTNIFVYPRPNGHPAEQTIAGWGVDDLDAAMHDLEARGVTFEKYDMPNLKTDKRGIAHVDGVSSAWFKDSEGNILALTEM
jgi:catechol 2,3-dioxygenase-like lactoylglutathione lyase family enzyme